MNDMDTATIYVPVLKIGPSTAYRAAWSNEKKRLPEPIQYGPLTIEPKDGQLEHVNYHTLFTDREQMWTVIWCHVVIPADADPKLNFRPVPIKHGPSDVAQGGVAANADLLKVIDDYSKRLQDATPDIPPVAGA